MSGHIRERIGSADYALHFIVEGSGLFPLDMLRYDGCYPISERDDVPAIAASYQDSGNFPEKRRVHLAARPLKGEKFVNLTPARWASFGWHIVEINGKAFVS